MSWIKLDNGTLINESQLVYIDRNGVGVDTSGTVYRLGPEEIKKITGIETGEDKKHVRK